MSGRRGLAGDAVWVLAGQILVALGTLVGLRLLTEVMDRQTYGEVVLLVGIAGLAIGVACTPMTQAAQHFFPELSARGQTALLRLALRRSFARITPWILAATAALALGLAASDTGAPWIAALLGLLFACDCARSVQASLLNAARQHRRYALWLAAEAWMRPLAAAAAVHVYGQSASVAIVSYLLVSLLLLVVLSPRPQRDARAPEAAELAALEQRIGRYARPLFPLGLVDWSNGVADRYLIGGLLSVADAGVYAASYSLASRPFQMLSGSLELTLRPPYQAAVSSRDPARARRLLGFWLLGVTGLGMVGVALLFVLRQPLANLLLGEDFRSGADLMPWIALGYALLAIAQVFQRVCFAHGDTRAVLAIQASAAAVGLVATAIGAWGWGLAGGALAVPACFSVQLAVSMLAARRTHRRAALQGVGVSANG